jgi:hypothetical protein
MAKCEITMFSEPMFPYQANSPCVGIARCATHGVRMEGPVHAGGMCPEGRLQRLERIVEHLCPDRSDDV